MAENLLLMLSKFQHIEIIKKHRTAGKGGFPQAEYQA